jgi:hypothetical protein
VSWSKSGEVKLLNIAEKAAEESQLPVEPLGEPSAEKDADAASSADPKEDDKRVVTVSTFGFPEVCIEPSTVSTEEGAEMKTDKKEGEGKGKGGKEEGKEDERKQDERKEGKGKEEDGKEKEEKQVVASEQTGPVS